MTQSDSKLQNKWERILRTRGLGIVQPITDNSEGESQLSMGGMVDDMTTLRKKFSGESRFMESHQIMKVRSMEREVPEWAMSNEEVQRILLKSFPKLKTRPNQMRRAGRWARIIYLYYRMKQPTQVVAKEMKMKESTLETTIRNIGRAARGLTVMGGERRQSSHTHCEGITEGRHETIKSPLLHRAGNGSNGEAGTPQKDVPLPQAG